MCAPNDVWSLGVILVNLTCGRNPWKQASFQDSTYRAYSRSQDFLKTILPVTDELNDILGRIFNPCPELRITLGELRERIMACPRLTASPMSTGMSPPTPPVTPDHLFPYVSPPEEVIVDDFECDAPLSPVSTISDDGSLTSSGSTISDLDEDFIREQQQEDVPFHCAPQSFDTEVPRDACLFPTQEFVPQHYTGPVPASMAPPQVLQQPMQCAPQPIQAPAPGPSAWPSKSYFPLWDVVRYVRQVPLRQPHAPFHQTQVLPTFQGCF